MQNEGCNIVNDYNAIDPSRSRFDLRGVLSCLLRLPVNRSVFDWSTSMWVTGKSLTSCVIGNRGLFVGVQLFSCAVGIPNETCFAFRVSNRVHSIRSCTSYLYCITVLVLVMRVHVLPVGVLQYMYCNDIGM